MGDECSVYYGNKNLRCGIDAKGRREMRGQMIWEECLQRRSAAEHAAAIDGNVAHVPLANDDQRRHFTESPTLSLTDAQSTVLHPAFSNVVVGVNSASALTNTVLITKCRQLRVVLLLATPPA